MLRRSSLLWAVALGLGLAHTTTAQEPRQLGVESWRSLPKIQSVSPSQELANSVAAKMRQSGQLQDYRVDITVTDGAATLTGDVATEGQRDEALRLAQGVPGIVRVIDRLTIRGNKNIYQVQFPPAANTLPTPTKAAASPVPNTAAAPTAAGNGPMPIYRAPVPNTALIHPPKMPPYAWPTYAPYNNYSRVGYPTAYPYKSWPYIGPFYPFPKIPLGWRSVKLEWDDGYWWFSKTATKYDWWRLRFW